MFLVEHLEAGRPLLYVGWVDRWTDGWMGDCELKSTVGPYLQERPASEI